MGMKCPKCDFDNPSNTRFCGNCATPLPISEGSLEAPTETIEVPFFMPKTGSVLSGRFEIIEEIGKGGMGKVYKVLDREISEKIALKLIRPEIASNEKIIERFRNELKSARKIAHKNVCQMFDIGKDGENRYITMEYVSGEDLKKSIQRMEPLTMRKALSIAKQICHGLSEAHHQGIVHRDLKPHNIMIDIEGNTKIMDFGIALSQEAKAITDVDILIGTPQYLSPEQVEGKKADQRSDIYSLGIIMFEMVTGQVPFDGDTTLAIAVKHKSEMPRDPREFNVQIPEDLSQLILKCMEKDPDRRYQTVEELCARLTSIEQEIPTTETTIIRPRTDFKTSISKIKLPKIARFFLLAVLIVVGGFFIYDRVLKKGSLDRVSPTGQKWKNSIVVLPFKDFSPQKEEAPISLILTDMLILNLHALGEMRVLPLTTALAYQNSMKDIKTIGEELNVNYVLEGSVIRTEDKLRINPQLSRVSDGTLIWAQTYESSHEEYSKLQESITKAVVGSLGIERADEKLSALAKKAPSEPLTNKYYARGRNFELRYYSSYDERDFEHCVENYFKVIEIKPDSALTYWRLGDVHEARFIYEDKNRKFLDLMFLYYQKAYDIDPNSAEANIGVGWSYFYKEEMDRAYEYMKRAFEINPESAEINHKIGMFFRSIGLYDAALRHFSKAIELDPMPFEFVLWHYVWAESYSILGLYEEAINILRDAVLIKPDVDLHLLYGRQLIKAKQIAEADIQITKAENLAPDAFRVKRNRALIHAVRGDKTKALEIILDDTEKIRYEISSCYALLGMKEEAIKNIKIGIEDGFERIGMYLYPYPFLKNNPWYSNLRKDREFQEIMRTEKIRYEEKLRKYGDLF